MKNCFKDWSQSTAAQTILHSTRSRQRLLHVAYKMHIAEEGSVVDSLLIVGLIVCWDLVCGPSFVMQYLVSFLCLQSSRR